MKLNVLRLLSNTLFYLTCNSVINKCSLKWFLHKYGISTFTVQCVQARLLIIWKYFLKLSLNQHLCFDSIYLWFPPNLTEMELEQANNFIKAVKASGKAALERKCIWMWFLLKCYFKLLHQILQQYVRWQFNDYCIRCKENGQMNLPACLVDLRHYLSSRGK